MKTAIAVGIFVSVCLNLMVMRGIGLADLWYFGEYRCIDAVRQASKSFAQMQDRLPTACQLELVEVPEKRVFRPDIDIFLTTGRVDVSENHTHSRYVYFRE